MLCFLFLIRKLRSFMFYILKQDLWIWIVIIKNNLHCTINSYKLIKNRRMCSLCDLNKKINWHLSLLLETQIKIHLWWLMKVICFNIQFLQRKYFISSSFLKSWRYSYIWSKQNFVFLTSVIDVIMRMWYLKFFFSD